MDFFKNLFHKKEKKLSFEEQIRNEISVCENSIFEYEQDIHKIRGWAINLMHKTLEIPKSYWYEELENLDTIFNLPANKNIDEEKKQEIKEISLSYKQQIELRKMKVEICKKNVMQLRQMLVDEQNIKKQLQIEDKKEFIIKEHKDKASSITNDISTEMVAEAQIEMLKNQIEDLQDELKLKQETNKQLDILYRKYGQSVNYDTTKIYLDELNKLLD